MNRIPPKGYQKAGQSQVGKRTVILYRSAEPSQKWQKHRICVDFLQSIAQDASPRAPS